MSYQIELRHFNYFKAVAEELNFRKAADRLFISQPGLSRQIKQMEEILKAKLFTRDKRSVALTPAGYYLLEEVNQLFNQIGVITRQVELIERGESGELKIGFLGSAMQKVVPGFLLSLSKTYPDIHASLDEMNNGAQIALIQKGELDIGFVRVAKVPAPLCLRSVMHDTFSLVLPENHWLNKKQFVSVKQLINENFILFSSDYSPLYYDKIMSIFADQGFEPSISHKSVHALTIFKLVESGLGIAIVPTSLSAGFDLKVKFIELTTIPQQTTLSAVWSENNQNPILQKAIGLLFSEEFS